MPFCSNCGHELNTNAKYCSNCGVPYGGGQSIGAQKRQQEYAGKIIKCPSCGERLAAFQVKCPSCGYEIREAKASSSVYEFALRLEQATSEDQRLALIRSFPIPNTKEDILEYIILASSNIETELSGILLSEDDPKSVAYDAWIAKFNQAYQKAQLLFEKSSELQEVNLIYDKIHEKIKKEVKFRKTKKILKVFASCTGAIAGLLLIIWGVLIPVFSQASMDSSRANTLILGGGIVLIITAVYFGKKGMGLQETVIGSLSGIVPILIGIIIPVFSHRSMDSSRANTLILIGIIVLIIVAVNFIKTGFKK